MKHNEGEVYKDNKGETWIKTRKGRVVYYRFLVEEYLGFTIPEGYSIHHLNSNHSDNRLENLAIINTSLHFFLHRCKAENLFTSNLEHIKNNPEILN